MRNAITRALPRDGLLSIHGLKFWRLVEQGRLKELDRCQPLSLDATTGEEENSLYQVLATCSTVTPVASDAARLQVETLLGGLTPREQSVLRLFHGLDEADGRTLTRKEIAALLGPAPQTVREALKRARRRLRAAPKDPAPRQEPRDKEAERQARRAAPRASLAEASAGLEGQGRAVTMRTRAREAQGTRAVSNART